MFAAWIFASAMLFAACGQDAETAGINPEDTNSGDSAAPCSVRFSLAGSVGTPDASLTPASKAAAVTQTDLEKKVTNLYAVVAFDPDGSSVTAGTTGHESDNDRIFRIFPIKVDSDPVGQTYELVLGQQGRFNIAFIANYRESQQQQDDLSLPAALKQAEGKTVKEFKQIQESMAPDLNASFLMNSPFYAVQTSFTSVSILDKVEMTRAVARIDLLNQAEGIVVKRVVFHHYATHTLLYNDTPNGNFDPSTITDSQTYDIPSGLPGNPDETGNGSSAWTGKIYSYEQFAGVVQGATDQAPSIDIVYSVPSDPKQREFTHTVKFVTQTGNGEQDTQTVGVPIKRNNHYRVVITNSNGKADFSLQVKDWDKGETFQPTHSDLAGGTSQPLPSPSALLSLQNK